MKFSGSSTSSSGNQQATVKVVEIFRETFEIEGVSKIAAKLIQTTEDQSQCLVTNQPGETGLAVL